MKNLEEEILLTRYKENCDQARHHETLRERTTVMVATTTGVLLGLAAFKDGDLRPGTATNLVASFIVLLGLFGIFASWMFDGRAREHRRRLMLALDLLRAQDLGHYRRTPIRLAIIWYLFHAGIAVLGGTILVITN
ncbi:MAG TPA: hypothetical protein VEO54_18950 [Thermoanaerobaculia bacterium]|nr:hypothetical protein [Thermoanaerobaculia bacterium]